MLLGRQIALWLLALATTVAAFPQPPSPSSAAHSAFSKIQKLAGRWEGKDDKGNRIASEFVQVAGNTAVMETLTVSGMEDMVTLYSLDENAIALVHYCPTNNQPRMRAIPSAGPVKQLVFVFTGAGNLPDMKMGHEQRLVLEFVDDDHIIERWTWRRDGNNTEMVFPLARVRTEAK